MFRKKGVSEVEEARENEIKISLTQELSAALKAIQREKVDCEEQDVYSTDTANTICTCIEAIFLHGLKSKAVTKLANYVGLKNQASSQPSLNFWNFVSRFTHGEVISQLKHLGQINTEIGFCRAWVRVALNDGILESYVDAMVADKKTLGYFYNNFAYLRDTEQPGIMLTYLQGLMSFEFKLSYNASVLNTWTYAPLRLAGIIDTQDAPPPVIKPAAKRPQDSTKSSKKKKDGDLDNDTSVEVTRSSSRSKGHKKSDKDSTHNPMEQPSFGNPPDNSYYVTSSHFTTRDVEAFKKLGRGAPQSISECSSSSHVSAPDPPHMNVSPAAYVDRFESMKGSPMSTDSSKVGQGYDSFDGAETDKIVQTDGVNDDDNVQRFDDKYTGEASIVNETDIKKKTDLEESWEEFYKSPLKKEEEKLDRFSKIQRLDSVNRDVREEALLRSILNSESSNNVEDEPVVTSSKTGEFNDVYGDNTVDIDSDNVGTDIGDVDIARKSDVQVKTYNDNDRNSITGKLHDSTSGEVTSDTSDLLNMSEKLLNEIGIKDDIVDGINTDDLVTELDDSIVEVERLKSTPKKSKGKKLDNLKPQLSLSPPKSAEAELSDAVAETVVQIRTLENPDYLSKHRLSLPAISPMSKQQNSGPRKSLPNIMEGTGNVIKTVESIYNSGSGGGHQDPTGLSPSQMSDGLSTSPYNTGSPSNMTGRGDVSINTEQEMARELSEKRQSGSNNLLCSGRGWSSSFDSEIDDNIDTFSLPRSNSGLPIARPKTESFGSLLQNYTPASSLSARSVDDVISNLPHRTDTVLSPASSQKSEEGGQLEGFEVLMNNSTIQDTADASRLEMFSTIANEKGLDSQNFQCKGCSRAIGLIFGKQRVCKYDGGYYCYECHENDVYYIPALIIHNWDFRKHQVCKKNLEFLQDNEEQPYLNIEEVNPRLYDHVPDMEDIRNLRTQLMILKTYLFTCKQSIAEDFRKLLWPRDYLFESTELYSLADLLQVPNGALATSIKKVIKFATKHVYSCRLCSQKGFICELCHNAKVIYPFEMDSTYRCSQCKSVYHKECKTDNRPCPKCVRRASRQSFQGNNEILLTPDYDQRMEHNS